MSNSVKSISMTDDFRVELSDGYSISINQHIHPSNRATIAFINFLEREEVHLDDAMYWFIKLTESGREFSEFYTSATIQVALERAKYPYDYRALFTRSAPGHLAASCKCCNEGIPLADRPAVHRMYRR